YLWTGSFRHPGKGSYGICGRSYEKSRNLGGKIMILYQALSSYQILECIIHRQVFYRDKQAVLLLGNYINERMPWYQELESRGFFDQIFLFRFGGYKGTEEEILGQIEKEYQKTIPYAPEEFEKLLIAGIHTYLQV